MSTSLASFLLDSSGKKNEAIDAELDALFRSQSTQHRPDDHPVLVKKKKRRSSVHEEEPDSKRIRPSPSDEVSPAPAVKQKTGGKRRVQIAPESSISDTHEPRSDDGGDNLIHETLQNDTPAKSAERTAKKAPPDETKERRDARTIFIGNLAPDVAIKRPLQKQLHRHILGYLPTAKIESTRFRSVAFQIPTSKLPETGDDTKKNKQPRQHDRDRASSWRDAHATDTVIPDEKKFLTPSEKKKIAFIHKEIHSDADSVHAYVVFAYPPPPHARPANVPPPPPIMDPFEAAQMAVDKCHGTMFLDRMLRVDAVIKKTSAKSVSDNTLLSSAIGDPKLTIFVGNLDFASKEEDLRVFFEGAVSAERGPPNSQESPVDGEKPKCWVTRVRMIRDKDSQLGKGFAYVQFSDRTCVDEMLALEPGKLKFAKRRLRIQRCKSVPNAASTKRVAAPSEPARTLTSERVAVVPVLKGDPSLGERLAKLTKEERKRAKAADADRVARRMAKKKARHALANHGAPAQDPQRERVRKSGGRKSGSSSAPAKKGRTRSEKSLAKRNVKK